MRLSAARGNACAVQLPNGGVLIVGGEGQAGALASVDVYANGKFESRAPLQKARYDHACAVLPDGSVLVAGGRTNLGITDSVEIYDPGRDAWTAGPTMLEPRAGATASALPDHRVLFAGGDAPGHVLDTLELYDPAAGRFVPVDPRLASQRRGHAAAVLHDGRVLIAGGSTGAAPLDTVEIFDPKTVSLSNAGKMSKPRDGLTATTLLGGRVLLLGGSNGDSDLATAETFDPTSGALRLEPAAMAVPRRGHSAVLIPQNNTVLIMGGTSASAAVESYIPWQRRFQSGGELAVSKTQAVALPLREAGRVLLAGGTNAGGPLANAETASAPTLRAAYRSGKPLEFNGAGWLPGQSVEISLAADAESDRHFTTVAADAGGAIHGSYSLPESDGPAPALFVSATQLPSSETADAPALLTAQSAADVSGVAFQAFANLGSGWMGWLNGNSAYLEGDLVPVRLAIPTTPGQSYTAQIGFTFETANGVFADWPGTSPLFANGIPVNPCDPSACGTPAVVSFPTDDTMNAPFPPGLQAPGSLNVYGANSVIFLQQVLICGPMQAYYCYTNPGDDSEIRYIEVSFTATSSTVYLSYGIHLAAPAFWGNGANSSAGGVFWATVNGAPTTYTIPVNTSAIIDAVSTTSTTVTSSASSGATSGQSITFTATVTANPSVPSAFGTVTFFDDRIGNATCANPGNSQQIGGGPQPLNGSGIATVGTASLAIGTHRILACYGGLLNSSRTFTASSAFTAQVVTAPPVATHFGVSVPASADANVPFSVTVTALSSTNTTITNYTGTVHFTSSDTFSPILPSNYTFTPSDNGVHTFTNAVALKQAGPRTVTVADDDIAAPISGTSSSIIVAPAAATHFQFTGSSTATAGASFGLIVKALDAYGNIATGYTGTIHFTSSDSNAVLPSNYTFVGGDNGQKSFAFTLKTGGSQTITATDTVNASVTGPTSSITVSSGSVSSFSFAGPTSAAAGASAHFDITAKDAYGNTVSSYSGTVRFTSSDPAATPPGQTTFTNGTAGVSATFATVGAQTLTAADIGNPAATGTVNVTVRAGAATRFTLSPLSFNSAGSQQTITVTARDAYSNVATGYVGTVHFTSADTRATLPADYTFVAGDSGVHAFNAVFRTPGVQTVTITDSNSELTVSGTLTIVQASTLVTLTATSSNASYGQPITFTAGGLPVAATGTVTFRDGPSTIATRPVANGTASFTTSTIPAGSYSISALYSGDVSYATSTSAALPVTITAGGAVIAVSFLPSPPVIGQPVQATVTVTPASASGAVRLSAGSVTLATADLSSGSATASFTMSTIGATTIHVAYLGDSNFNPAAIDVPLVLVAGTPATITVLSGGSQSAALGQPFAAPLRLRVRDRFGNATPGVAVRLSTPVAGASGLFATGGNVVSLTTDSEGEISSGALTANAVAGNYLVTASAGDVSNAAALRNVGALSVVGLAAVDVTAVQGGASPASVAVPVSATGGTPILSASLNGNPAWASAAPQSVAAPGAVSVSFDTRALAAGTYTSTLVLTPAVDYYAPITVPVQVTIGPPSLTLAPASLTFQKTSREQVTAAQIVTVASNGVGLSYAAVLSGGTLPPSAVKLDRATGSTEGVFSVVVDFSSLKAGAYSATVRVTPSGASTTPIDLPVQVVVPDIWFAADPTSPAATAATAALASGQMQFYESATPAAPRLTGAALIANSDTPKPFQVTLEGQQWLSVSPMRAVTPANLTITAQRGSLAPGTYHGKVHVLVGGAATGGQGDVPAVAPLVARIASVEGAALEPRISVSQSELVLDVTYVVDAPVAVSASPQRIQVASLAAGGPQSVAIDLTSASTVQLATAVAGASWVRLASSVPAPGRLTVQVDPTGFAPGTYRSTITLANPGQGIDPIAIPVELTVIAPPENTLVLTSSANPAPLGTPVTFTASAQMAGASAAGVVAFYDGATLLATVPVANGQAAYTVALSAGYHNIRAAFTSGSWTASANVGQQIDRWVSAVALRIGPSPSVFGQPFTLTAEVSGDSRGASAPPPTGEIQFYEGNTLLGKGVLSSRSATLTVPGLATGLHRLSARYVGDQSWNLSESAIAAHTVARASTAATLKITVSGDKATLAASVSPVAPGAGNPTGRVQFVDSRSSTVLGAADLASGAASVELAAAELGGASDIKAVYAGDTNFVGSNSASLTSAPVVNAASQTPQNLAPDAIATLYGANLANATLRVRDSGGASWTPSILYTSESQINFVVPNVALGLATVEVSGPNGVITSGTFSASRVAPGLFTVAGDGKGVAAAQIVRVHADGTQDAPQDLAADRPIDLGQSGDRVFLVLYGTGLRHNTDWISCLVNGRDLPIAYTGAHPLFAGLDQVNVELPADLAGSGQASLTLALDGVSSNTVQLLVK